MTKQSATLEKPAATHAPSAVTTGVDRSRDARRAGFRDRLTITRAAVVIAWVLISTATALSLSALLVHQQALELDANAASTPGVLDLLTLGALALLGALAASIAAVNQQSKLVSGWVSLVTSAAGLLAVLLVTLPLR